MKKSDIVASVAEAQGLSKSATEGVIDAVFEQVAQALKNGDSVALAGFGTFEVRHRAARTGRNPATGEQIQIAASNAVGFKAAKRLKDQVND